jgi:F-type H+-transporting ATPase subunit epsilon
MKTDEIYLQVISPERVIFQGNVSLVRFPGKESPFVILRDHAPIMALLDKGVYLMKVCRGRERFL